MKLFDGDTALKDKMVERARQHRMADRVVQGDYGIMTEDEREWRGCAIGCLATSTTAFRPMANSEEGAQRMANEFHIPENLAYFAEAAFEGQQFDKTWPEKFAASLPVGVELTNDEVAEWAYEYLCENATGLDHRPDSPEDAIDWLKAGNGWSREARNFIMDKLASITPDEEYERTVAALTELVERDKVERTVMDAITTARSARETVPTR